MSDDLKDFQEAGKKLLDLGDRRLVLSMRRDIRVMAQPAGARILEAIASGMPKRGGLADRVRSQGRITMLVDLKRGARIQIANKAGWYMGPFERGTIRHPLFGNSKHWYPQTVPGGLGAAQLEKEAPQLGSQLAEKVTETMRRAL